MNLTANVSQFLLFAQDQNTKMEAGSTQTLQGQDGSGHFVNARELLMPMAFARRRMSPPSTLR